jgi:UDP-GlcNAc:undecaprenyl-phosphate GlcNAc-1-phosphate transferase
LTTSIQALLVACAVTAALVAVLRPLAVRIGLVDVPKGRKSHHGPVPLIGGVAMFLALVASCLAPAVTGLSWNLPGLPSFLTAGGLLVAVGVADDFLELTPGARFVAQASAALVMALGAGVLLADLGPMTLTGRTLELGLLAIPFTIFATVGVINALNMCDGMDGLSGSQALVSLGGFAIALALWGGAGADALIAVLAGGVAGFLLFNMRLPGRARASVFMGDAGSMFLGFALTWFAVSLSQGPDPVLKPAAALWFIMVPIIDAVAMMLRRIVKGRSPFAPDREHLHHIFLLAGFSVNETVAIMAGLSATGVAIGLASTWLGLHDLAVAGAFLGVGLLYFWMIMHAWRVMRFLSRSICRRRSPVADRRVLADRRQAHDELYVGPERRSGVDRRKGVPRRAGDVPRCRPLGPPARVRAPLQPAMARTAAPAASAAAPVSRPAGRP